jgi:glutaminyl-tRNA synthetase
MIYPTYDWAHGQSDAIEGVTHSICTLEFADHRPLYDWCLDHLDLPHGKPEQIEFARLNLTHTVMSKRLLKRLVDEGVVDGWDDPRMPTLSGFRRRGYTPEAIRSFCNSIGVSKTNGILEFSLLEHHLREDLNKRAARVMAVLDPIRLVIDNYPEDLVEEMDAVNNPEDPSAGTRKVPFSKVLYIEREDFREDPPKQYYRLGPGREVRLQAEARVERGGLALVLRVDGQAQEAPDVEVVALEHLVEVVLVDPELLGHYLRGNRLRAVTPER